MTTPRPLADSFVLAAAYAPPTVIKGLDHHAVFLLLLQIAVAAGHQTLADAGREGARFVRADLRELSGIFFIVFAMLLAAWLASFLAWSGVGLIAFVPLVGLAVFPLQLAALLLRGLVFEYVGLTAMGAYVSLYRRYAEAEAERTTQRSTVETPSLRPAH